MAFYFKKDLPLFHLFSLSFCQYGLKNYFLIQHFIIYYRHYSFSFPSDCQSPSFLTGLVYFLSPTILWEAILVLPSCEACREGSAARRSQDQILQRLSTNPCQGGWSQCPGREWNLSLSSETWGTRESWDHAPLCRQPIRTWGVGFSIVKKWPSTIGVLG